MDAFARRLLAWFDDHGRKDLPWQKPRSDYRVWLSEIMLQQTQVSTVIPYFERFIKTFPDLQSLAAASLDDVIAQWAGLGYYARARNLHRCAQTIVADHAGRFPRDIEQLQSLPGIGRSTAGAIAALAFAQREAILDGNVKRVLSRYHAVTEPAGSAELSAQLWKLAERHTPSQRVRDYTQAIMDLGATVCTRMRPQCGICPQRRHCKAHKQEAILEFPAKPERKRLPHRQTRVLVISDARRRVLLERRPPRGIWGGLWSLPEMSMTGDIDGWFESMGLRPIAQDAWTPLTHTFTHFRLTMHPLHIAVRLRSRLGLDTQRWLWYKSRESAPIGIATPVRKLLARFEERP